jgi:hypothetical protein
MLNFAVQDLPLLAMWGENVFPPGLVRRCLDQICQALEQLLIVLGLDSDNGQLIPCGSLIIQVYRFRIEALQHEPGQVVNEQHNHTNDRIVPNIAVTRDKRHTC